MYNAETERFDILLVEDDISDVLVFKDAIETSHVDRPSILVAVCHTLREAEEALHAQRYDLILLDVNLPDACELEGFKRLIMLFPEIPIVIHSGVYSPRIASEAISLGAQDYIVKGTMSKDDLVRTLIHAKIRHNVQTRLRNCLTEV